MFDKTLIAFEELFQIAKSEATAEESRHRMNVFQVMARLGTLGALLLRDAETEEIYKAIEELEEGNERLEEMAREIKEKQKEREERERMLSV
jgi:ribosome-associated translation inhibitor RaiA